MMDFVNNLDPKIKFTCEAEGSSVDYLQVKVQIDGDTLSKSWHRKPQKKNIFLSYYSNVPDATKKATIFNTLHLIYAIHGKRSDSLIRDLDILTTILTRNSYPINFLQKIFKEFYEKWEKDRNNGKINSALDPKQQVQKAAIEESLKPNTMKFKSLVDVPADGHCLLHAIAGATNTTTSYDSQLFSQFTITIQHERK